MKPSRVGAVLVELTKTRWPAFVWGPPGVGKSATVRAVAEKLGRPVLDVRAALLDPTDIRGIPFVEDGMARWSPPSFLPQPGNKPGILFFDELSSAPPLVQASLYQLTLDRRVGEYVLPDGWSIIAAGNRVQDGSLAFRMPSALSNRFVHIDFEVDFDDWKDWATMRGIHPLIVAFLSVRRQLLFSATVGERAFPTPRSWEMASDTIAQFRDLRNAEDVLLGIVGEGATIELLAFIRDTNLAKVVDALIKRPMSATLPDRLDLKFAVLAYLASCLSDDRVFESACVLLGRFEPEIAMVLVRDIVRIRPKDATRPEVLGFINRHKADVSL